MNNINKMCSFYVNGWHLIVMILPYISREIEKNEIVIISEDNLELHVKSILDKLNINDEMKKRIRNLNWNKANDVDNSLKNLKEACNIFVIGSKKYIENINGKIEKLNKKLTIINCFEVLQFNQNMEEILNTHDKVLNTSGIRDIEETFGGYSKKQII